MEYIIVQAGGKGTRLGYLTQNKPKALVPIENKPMLFHLFNKYPDKRFIIIADYKKDVLREYLSAFANVKYQIVDAVKSVLEQTPPELVGDISEKGIVMTGGGALIKGFDKLIESKIGIKTYVADEAVSCVAIGTGKSLDYIDKWYNASELLKLCEFAAYPRGKIDAEKLFEIANDLKMRFGTVCHIIEAPCIDISSTELRSKLQNGDDVGNLVPEGVAEYIYKHNLYKNK